MLGASAVRFQPPLGTGNLLLHSTRSGVDFDSGAPSLTQLLEAAEIAVAANVLCSGD